MSVNEIEFLASIVGQHVDGWRERVEYGVVINGRAEARAKTVKQDPLLAQLKAAVHAFRMRESSEIGPAAKIVSPHPGNLEASDLLHRIEDYAHTARKAMLSGLGQKERRKHALPTTLRSLVSLAAELGDEDYTSAVTASLRAHARQARLILGYDRPMVMLEGCVCGDCGGALVVATDAQSDVRCIGKPEEPSCRRIYYRWQWMELAGYNAA